MKTHRYWKANKQTAEKIKGCLQEWKGIIDKACSLSKKHGGRGKIFTVSSWGNMFVAAFAFAEGKVDEKLFVRVKGTDNGWRPRRSRKPSELCKQFDDLRCPVQSNIMKLIGMKDMKGMEIRTPGVKVVENDVYIITPDDVNAKGCKRISDIQFEKATTKRKSKK